MSERSRAAPWFGTKGERGWAATEREAVAARLRISNADPFSDGTAMGRWLHSPRPMIKQALFPVVFSGR